MARDIAARVAAVRIVACKACGSPEMRAEWETIAPVLACQSCGFVNIPPFLHIAAQVDATGRVRASRRHSR